MFYTDMSGGLGGDATSHSLIPVLVTGIQCAQVLGRERLFRRDMIHSRRGRAVAGFL
ncbi:UNVERIFIED_ORG: hypothetical protein GGI57_005691 [Rhizobium aethiopicum]